MPPFPGCLPFSSSESSTMGSSLWSMWACSDRKHSTGKREGVLAEGTSVFTLKGYSEGNQKSHSSLSAAGREKNETVWHNTEKTE